MARNHDLEALSSVLSAYTDWFIRVVQYIQYPLSEEKGEAPAAPDFFARWAENMKGAEVTEQLHQIHTDMTALAVDLLARADSEQAPPDFKNFDKFTTYFEEFVYHLRRFERDMLQKIDGVEPLTGLRSMDYFNEDMTREMDRLSRNGRPFSLAVIRIDRFEEIQSTQTSEVVESCIKLAANLVKKNVRAFDDAYRLGEHEFVVALKQASIIGGIKALKRLRADVEEEGVFLNIGGQEVPMSVSSCLTMPIPNDDIRSLLKYLKSELDESTDKMGSVLEYSESSPLERFLKTQNT